MTDKDFDNLAATLPLIKAWIAAVEAELAERIRSGVEFCNVTLVSKQIRRDWVEGCDVVEALTEFLPLDQAAPRVPLSVAQAEKALGKSRMVALAPLVQKKSTEPSLAYRSGTSINLE